ncbi:MAG: hypothetical protein Q7S10_02585 [bacterium]|nr:hypothetical protein [bacterium]
MPKIKRRKAGDLIEIEGEQDFVEKKYKDFLDEHEYKYHWSNPRILVGFFYLILFIIGLIAMGSWSDSVFYNDSRITELPKILGRISFVFTFTLFGMSLRAFKWSEIGKVLPWRAYFFEYLLISLMATLVIFSGVSLAIPNEFGYFFYTFGAPLAIVAGFRGYKTLEALMGKTS